MAKLWEKNYSLDSLIEDFTIGNDYIIDLELVAFDCIGSIAHAKMLNKIKVLDDDSTKKLLVELRRIYKDAIEEKFVIKKSDEDCHTAIEIKLTERLGEAGKKIHAGRSRNDQVLTCLRLYMKDFLINFIGAALDCVETISDFAKKYRHFPMVGRTHFQVAMPSSVALWATAYAEELIDEIKIVDFLYSIVDQSPLGAAASYGTPLPLDREYSAKLLGFKRVQNNVLYANNSRGKFEATILDALDNIALTYSKISTDLILFSSPEFRYFSLPDKLCTGSSIMPQKKNPDGLELVRAKSATISALSTTIKNIIRALPSGYNRDFQETKEYFIKACKVSLGSTQIINLTFKELQVNKEELLKAFTPDVFATDKVFELVQKGASFRTAYKEVGATLESLSAENPIEIIKTRTSTGTTGNLNLNVVTTELKKLKKANEKRRAEFYPILKQLL